eukprot:8406129-Pyramimonas_sp.AAC.1
MRKRTVNNNTVSRQQHAGATLTVNVVRAGCDWKCVAVGVRVSAFERALPCATSWVEKFKGTSSSE